MSIGLEGQNLIFLISQPRAGSTMTQQVLGNHPDIYTVSEPWIMLPPLYSLSFDHIEAEYNVQLSKIGWQTFCKTLPNEYNTYYHGLRLMYSYIYNSALNNTEKEYFLDKTPRYYYIIPELFKVFPKAQFLILFRNPLAVLCSILQTWIKNDWNKLDEFRNDLIKAPGLLIKGMKKLGNNCLVLNYEKLISDTENEFQRIFQLMGLEFSSEIMNYGGENITKWRFGDQKLVYEKTRPDPQNLDKWILSLKDPQIWQIANDYLEFLGVNTIYTMGYSYKDLRKILDHNQPSEVNSTKIFHFEWLLKPSSKYNKNSQESSYYIVMGSKEEKAGNLIEAETLYRQAIKLTPNLAWLYNKLAIILTNLQKYDEATSCHCKALDLNSDSAWFHYTFATTLIKQKKINEAIFHYQKALELRPNQHIIQQKLKDISE